MTAQMIRRACLVLVGFMCGVPTAARAEAIAPLPSFAEPALSPDGLEIAFVHAGDIWTVPSAGGVAHLLISDPATESRPIYSPDGKKLAFISTRTGNGDIYILTFATGELTRLTYDDGFEQLNAWSRDSKWLYFASSAEDLGAGNADIYRVRAEGGTPMAVSAEQYTNEVDPAPSPDGKTVAMSAGGNSRDWWRNGHANWNESHIWLRDHKREKIEYEELTKPGAREMWPMWSVDGNKVYCVSDRDGAPQNIVAYDLEGKDRHEPKPITHFTDGRVLWPSISYDGKTIVFERGFELWKVDISDEAIEAGAKPERLKITLRGAATSDGISTLNFTGGFRDLAVSPDGKKLAFVVHGEVFAVSAREGGKAVRVTNTPAAEGQIEWAPDSHRLVYVSERGGGGAQNVYLYDFAGQTETPLTQGDEVDSTPHFSPDGKHLAYRKNGSELRLLELASKKDQLLASGLAASLPPFDASIGSFAFSPKGQWLAYIDSGKRGYDNVYVIPTDSENAKPVQVTFFANTGSNDVSWSGDGKSLLFGTGMRTEEFQLARVDLVNRPLNFGEDQFRGLFDEEVRSKRPGGPRTIGPNIEKEPTTKPAAETPLMPTTKPAAGPATLPAVLKEMFPSLNHETFSFEHLRQKTSLLPIGMDAEQQIVTPDGKWCVFIGELAGASSIYAYPLDAGTGERPAVRQITSGGGQKSHLRAAPDSRDVYFLENGQIRSANIDSRSVREINVSAPMEVDFSQEKMEVANEAWMFLKLSFYDPKMHGADWNAVRKEIMPRVAGAKTADELRRILSIMIGELNASHLGIGSPRRGGASVGRLGLKFDRGAYERDGLLKVAAVLTSGPADQAGMKVGDSILAIDDEPVDAHASLQKLLDHKIGQRVVLRVSSDGKQDEERDVPVRPVDMAAEKTLLYRDWVEANRAYVAKASNGRLGYVHIADMSANAMVRLNEDLDAEAATREGVVVDIRANTGGFVSPFVLDVLSRKGYLTIGRRGAVDSPGRIYVGQRALDLPTILVTNHQSISDAENFTEGYRTLKLGKVVGEPTAGGVIFTSDVSLLDGTIFRIPSSKVTGHDGKSLEGEGRPVDINVHRQIGEGLAAKDTQLDAAAKEMLRQLDKADAIAKAKAAEKPKAAEAAHSDKPQQANRPGGAEEVKPKKAEPKAESGK